MSKFLIGLVYLFLGLSYGGESQEVLVAGCGWDRIGKLDYSTGAILWSRPAPTPEDCNDIEPYADGVLYAYRGGARLVGFDGTLLWDYKAPDVSCEVYTATAARKGGFLVAMCGTPSRIVYLDKKGQFKKEILFDTKIEGIHAQFRQILETPSSTFLIPLMGTGEVVEVNAKGEELKRVAVGGTPFSVHRTNLDGRFLVSLGDAGKIVEVNWQTGEIVREISNDNLIGNVRLLFVAELKMLANGNIIAANWNGHVADKNEPKLVEISPTNKVVYVLPGSEDVANISAFGFWSEKCKLNK